MLEGSKTYDWTAAGSTPRIRAGDITNIEPGATYDVIAAYDVVEHLHNPETVLEILHKRLKPDGVLLVSVPNRRSQFEKYFKASYDKCKREGKLNMSGDPHVQFRTPEEWEDFFKKQGFRIVAHDMTLGLLVNDCWAGFYGVKVRTFIEPVLLGLKKLGLKYKTSCLETLFYPAWLMEIVDRIDIRLKSRLHYRWGWNLFVLERVRS